jgi:hypothetical protein
MSIDPNDYCYICGDDVFVWLSDGTPVCINHFQGWLDKTKEDNANHGRARPS